MMRILVLTALFFTGAAAQSTPACANTCLSEVATQAGCSSASDAVCLCTQNVLQGAGQCLAQTCSATDLNAAEQAIVSFCENGAGNPSSAAASGSQSASGGSSASASAPLTTAPGPVSSPSQSASVTSPASSSATSSSSSATISSNSATTSSSASPSPSPNAATRASARAGALGVIIAALGASLVL